MTPERAQQVTEEWVFDLIDEAAKNARQIYFVYLGFIAYCMLTVLSSTDRGLILNASVRLPVVNAQVPLTAFYVIAPLLCILIFVHLMIALVDLRRLVLMAQVDPSAPRIYPWMVARAILLANGRLAWEFTDRTQVALTIVSVYGSLPLVLMAFAAGYARAHVPTFSYVIDALPIAGSILALAFYFQMVGTPARTAFQAVRSEWILFVMLAVVAATPYENFRLIVALASIWGLYVIPAGVLLILLAVTVSTRLGTARTRVRQLQRPLLGGFLLLVVVIFTLYTFGMFEGEPLISAFVALCMTPLMLTFWYLVRRTISRPPAMLAFFLFAAIAVHVGLLRLAWLSNHGDGLNVDLSYQVLSPVENAGKPGLAPLLNLSNAHLEGANLRHSILPRALLRSAYLSNANLASANLAAADLGGADLRGADFTGANLQGADLSRAKLTQTRFERADMRGANLNDVTLDYSYFEGTKLDGANMDSVRQVDNAFGLQTAQLLTAKSLRYAVLQEAREREIIEHAPNLVFGPARSQMRLQHLAELLLYTHPDNTQFTRAGLREMLVDSAFEHGPAWKRAAYVSYIGDGAIEDLLEAKLLSRVSEDSFIIPPDEAVKAVRARFPKRQ